MNSNKLVINPDKTHLMVMADKKDSGKRKLVTLQAGEHMILPTEKEKNAGWIAAPILEVKHSHQR